MRKVEQMKTGCLIGLLFLALMWGCTAVVDVEPAFRDFDIYEQDLRSVLSDQPSLELLETARQKRAEAGALAEQGKTREALPLVERALADARLAMEMNRMNDAARRAENCRMAVEEARTKWREALHLLNQTEEFVGKTASFAEREPELEQYASQLPASVLSPDSFPPATFEDVSRQWKEWRRVAGGEAIAAADLESAFKRAYAATRAPKVDEATVTQQKYIAARTVQMLECRVHAHKYEQECLEATKRTASFSDARAEALRATLDLERGLQDDLQRELDQFRTDAKTRQDELYNALSQMEGKFARIHRDARGTIVSLSDILFDFDKATLKRNVEFNLVKIATILNQFGEMKILIEGHTDNIGTEEYNLGLSQRRAQAVYDFLVSQDVDESRLSSEGYGESRPVADNDTEEGRQQNRRVDLVIQD